MPEDTQQQKPETEEKSPKRGKAKLLVIVAVVTFVLAGGGAGGWYFLGDSEGEKDAGAPAPEAPTEYILSLDSFVVNLADPGGRRYLKITLRAITDDDKLEATLEEDDILRSKIRDRMITVLASKTFDDVSTPVGKEGLRRQLQRELNGLLPDTSISELLFVEFVVQ